MRGSPILRAALVFLALLALAPLLWKLTRPAPAEEMPRPPRVVKVATVEARLNFSKAATRAVIQHLGRDVWSKDAPSLSEEFSAPIPWPPEGVELRVLVTWPDGTRSAAMRARITAPDGAEYDRTVWGDANADDVLTFK